MKRLLHAHVKRIGEKLATSPWEDLNFYAEFLAQTYYQVRHSTRLLAAAAARFDHDADGNSLHVRFAAHMAEEKSHERLCVHDLKHVKKSIDDYTELPSTRQFYEPQYYKIEHQAPIVLFGYILPLESLGPAFGTTITRRATAAHGAAGTTFLAVHSEEDTGHLDKAFAMLEHAAAREKQLIEQNIEQTAYAYLGMLDGITSASRLRHTAIAL